MHSRKKSKLAGQFGVGNGLKPTATVNQTKGATDSPKRCQHNSS